MRLGILPAAGMAERWGGYPKELLPVSGNSTLLSRAADSLHTCGCDVVVIITNPSKVQWHAHHLKHMDNIVLAVQKGKELWGAITTAIQINADEYFLMMPDTFVPGRPFPASLQCEFAMGLFETEEPERFGVVRDGRIVDKQPSGSPGLAWGVLAWKWTVAEYWRKGHFTGHTEALNEAIGLFGYGEWHLDYYYDIGSMKHYREFLLTEHANEVDGERFTGFGDLVSEIRRRGEYSAVPAQGEQVLTSLKEAPPRE